jgi:hypothetical protein
MPSLADENWTACTTHHVVLAFLGAEWDKWPHLRGHDRRLVTAADLSSDRQNNQRTKLLCSVRDPLLRDIPSDTDWFEVRHLRGEHLNQLRAINFPPWNLGDDENELEKVAARLCEPMRGPPVGWQPILWGHDRSEPLTILEGNHRMTALVGSREREKCALTAYVGLSPSRCRWHRADKSG